MDDPFEPKPPKRVVHARLCYVCKGRHGCMVVLDDRIISSEQECASCERLGFADCHALAASAKDYLCICKACALLTS